MMKIQNINALFLALAPALSIYTVGNGVSLCLILIFLLVVFNILAENINRSFLLGNNEIQWYMSIGLIGLFGALLNMNFDYFSFPIFLNNFIALTFFFFALILCTSNCNIFVLKKTLLFLGSAAAVICIVQRTQLIITGTFFKDFFLPGLVVNRDLETFSINRVSAFFTEPAHLSIYLIPIYYIELCEKKKFFAVLLCMGILFSGSTTGFLLLILLTIIYMAKNTKKRIYILYTFVGIALLYSGIMYLFPDVLIDNLQKLDSAKSSDVRLLGPLQYVSLFNIPQCICGLGLNQVSGFLHSNGIHLISDWGVEKNANYANAAVYMLLCYGLFGLLFFVRYIVQTIKSHKSDSGFILFFWGIILSDQVLFNMNLLYVLMFLILSKQLLNEKKGVNEGTLYN